ncbi:MAG TPA: energy transducer TonB [Ignavibacteriaceae bacterium]|jgi:protein TonB|nr:MAG: Gram-negative bacterial tonB protein [Ignavibacteria bacterium ADurb.Bin266]OQY73142.1 MAG: energy transducer TonB [Ignavibacteriales bacterium UTCHB2]HQF42479.1 energy transducer TonB [Ignavibacteriaceae bacterium]HQI41464.1 energy transducer TonB [Ignavibacteriaceae bacterium]
MAIIKTKKADLMSKYKRVFEISLIISLALLIVAFKFFPDFKGQEIKIEGPQELFQVEDIQQTKQENRPPPPPKPPIPIEAPSSDVLEDIEIGDTEIDITEQIEAPPPPPKEDKKIVEEEPVYFVAVEEMPEPIGGITEIQKKIIYPEIAKRAGVEGKVYVLAFVDESGTVTDVKLIKGIGAGCDEAAMDAVRKTKFKPGKQRGKPVKVQVSIPVVFKLQ